MLAKGSLYGRMISLTVTRLKHDVHMMRHSATACDPRHMADVTCCEEKIYSCETLQRISVRIRVFGRLAPLRVCRPNGRDGGYASDKRSKGEPED
jgi:hypothetical protein